MFGPTQSQGSVFPPRPIFPPSGGGVFSSLQPQPRPQPQPPLFSGGAFSAPQPTLLGPFASPPSYIIPAAQPYFPFPSPQAQAQAQPFVPTTIPFSPKPSTPSAGTLTTTTTTTTAPETLTTTTTASTPARRNTTAPETRTTTSTAPEKSTTTTTTTASTPARRTTTAPEKRTTTTETTPSRRTTTAPATPQTSVTTETRTNTRERRRRSREEEEEIREERPVSRQPSSEVSLDWSLMEDEDIKLFIESNILDDRQLAKLLFKEYVKPSEPRIPITITNKMRILIAVNKFKRENPEFNRKYDESSINMFIHRDLVNMATKFGVPLSDDTTVLRKNIIKFLLYAGLLKSRTKTIKVVLPYENAWDYVADNLNHLAPPYPMGRKQYSTQINEDIAMRYIASMLNINIPYLSIIFELAGLSPIEVAPRERITETMLMTKYKPSEMVRLYNTLIDLVSVRYERKSSRRLQSIEERDVYMPNVAQQYDVEDEDMPNVAQQYDVEDED